MSFAIDSSVSVCLKYLRFIRVILILPEVIIIPLCAKCGTHPDVAWQQVSATSKERQVILTAEQKLPRNTVEKQAEETQICLLYVQSPYLLFFSPLNLSQPAVLKHNTYCQEKLNMHILKITIYKVSCSAVRQCRLVRAAWEHNAESR